MKKIIAILLAVLMLLPTFTACSDDTDVSGTQLLSFSQAQSTKEMKKMDGKTVSIIGYMSTLSPISGSFMYLMNLPYQSCPFCIPNTTELANTIAVYAKSSDGFKFTDRAIQVVGTLEFGDYTDEFGYVYSYRIKDATYSILDTKDMDPKLQLWQQLASTDVIAEIYRMYEYVNFLCFWPTYTAEFGKGKDYLYPSDAKHFYQTDDAQYNYGYQKDYFSNIIATIESVSETEFTDLISNVEQAEALAKRAISELENGKYKTVPEYSGTFKDNRTQYKLDRADELKYQMDAIYSAFAKWLAGWEL